MANYYEASSRLQPRFASLQGRVEADLCVVGGGVTGLSTALHAAMRGRKVVVLESERIGFGASGRNGGQLIPGMRKGAQELVAQLGRDQALRLLRVADEARAVLLDLVQQHGIECDLRRTGHLLVAHREAAVDDLRRDADATNELLGEERLVLRDRAALAGEIGSERFYGGLVDRLGGHFHPLDFTRGLAAAAERAGVQIFEASRVRAVETAPRFRAVTDAGEVIAADGILAGDALLGSLVPRLDRVQMPIRSYVVATERLGARAAALIPQDRAVADTRFVVNYFRRTADGRLLFGGGETYSNRERTDIAGFVRPHVEDVFPKLADAKIEFGWSGLVSVTMNRLPQFGRFDRAWFAHGYSGQGALLSVLAGRVLAEALDGDTAAFDTLAAIPATDFPGGTALRGPLHVAGMLWYALRDRIG